MEGEMTDAFSRSRQSSTEDYKVPLTHTGYLMKRGQRIKTWKRRYVVVELGRLSYFEKSNGTSEPPYGLNQKGSLTLYGYNVEDGPKDKMLLLKHNTDKRELLIEVESDENEALNWRNLFEHHIRFCNENPQLYLQVGASFQEDEAKRAVVANKYRGYVESLNLAPLATENGLDEEKDEHVDEQPGLISAPVPITPKPAFVVKTKRIGGLKVFINVGDHESIPVTDRKKGHKRWPIFVLSPSYVVSVDKNAEECHVMDACVHPSVIEECQEDASGEAKEELCFKIMDAIISREKKEKVDAAIDKSSFSFPRLSKKYKGEKVASFLIPRNIYRDCQHSSVFTSINIDDHVDMDEIEEEEEVDEDVDPFARQSSITDRRKTMTRVCSMKRGLFSNDGNPKKFITLNVERKIGAVIRERPDKKSNRVKTLLRDTKTYCYGRITGPDKNLWYRVLDGWTRSLTDGGQRMLKPVCAEQPISSRITGVNLVEEQQKGFIFSTTIPRLTFVIELHFPREALLRLQRTHDDFVTFFNGLKDEKRTQTDKMFPEYMVEELSSGVELAAAVILEIMEDLDQWLKRTIEDVQFEMSSSMRKFLQCTDADCKKMDVDLSAENGLDGAWPMDYV